jgi:hypothetical protein
MTKINVRRVVLGGLVAGLVANVFDFVITSYILDADLQKMATRLNLTPANAWRSALVVFIGGDFVWGLLIVFTYAAIRPRFGPGPMTAIISGVIPWAAIAILTLQLSAVGVRTFPSWAMAGVLYLLSAVVSSLVGAALYREA